MRTVGTTAAKRMPKKQVERLEGKRQVPSPDGFAEIEDSALSCLRNKNAHVVSADPARVAEGGFELSEFAFELEGVQTDTRGQNLDRVGIKLQAALANSRRRPFDEGLFVSSKTKIRKVLSMCVHKPRK